ncbi:MAG: response regulator [Betaproteobacteria bacterium]|nr:response regulator [Betaproteobacteria bacterium]
MPTLDPQPTILVVDDTAENIAVLSGLLKPDYRVRAATSGARALEVAALDPRPDLILLDVMMPEMDGYDVLGALRASPRSRDIPVVFVTAMDGAEEEVRGLDLGAADYITKPFRPAIVLARFEDFEAIAPRYADSEPGTRSATPFAFAPPVSAPCTCAPPPPPPRPWPVKQRRAA